MRHRVFDELRVREEMTHDRVGIRKTCRAAFGGHEEENLVDALRRDGDVVASLVAVEGNNVLGHILFSRLDVRNEDLSVNAAALAQMAVVPDRQREGIGTRMIRSGLALCRSRGVEAVFVLGHPEYYPRFGFSAAKAEGIDAPFSGDVFMAIDLKPGTLRPRGLSLEYPAAFGVLR